MIFSKEDKFLLVKIYKPYLKDIDIYNHEQIANFFKDIFLKIKKKYNLSGLFYVDVYINDKYGMIIEINNICFYKNEFDIKIKFHLNCIFFNEIDSIELLDFENIYYYKDKFYAVYENDCDKEIIYKDTIDILNKGIKVC